MDNPNSAPDLRQLAADEPFAIVERDGVAYHLLGTAHVSPTSVAAVRRLIDSGDFDAIAVELCQSRFRAMTQADQWKQMNLFELLRKGQAGMMMASLALAAYQRRIAEQFGIEPGAEMKAAIELAEQHGLPLQLIDRDIGITLRRASQKLSWWRRWILLNGLIVSLFSRERISEADIEALKQGDLLNQTFTEFSEHSPALYEGLIGERDRFMAARLRQDNGSGAERTKNVLAVIGAGHLAGMEQALHDDALPQQVCQALNAAPPPSQLWKAVPWAVLVLVLTGFTIGFARSPELGWSLVLTWVVINGGLSALGATLARAHPLTILTALVAAPLTSLNPTVGAGMVTGAVQAWIRPPLLGDFQALRDEVGRLSGWYRNRVAHVFLVFFLANLGSAAGTWIAGLRMVQQLTQ